ncbi:MAG: hypothetical protein H7Z72_19170 [Bacteroidetes bacterium]|nr:hypothetical protein [Fibrella sp.]
MHYPLLVTFCVCCVTAQAQTGTAAINRSDAYWNIPLSTAQTLQSVLVESQTGIPDPASASNTIVVQQNGFGNQATLQVIAGSQNRFEANQSGGGNGADAVLAGSNNSLVLNQTGGGNAINLGLSGNSNRFLVTQDGGDRATLQGQQKDNTRFELVQGSGNNSLTLDNSTLFKDPFGSGIPNLRIEQSGGASITVQQGKVIGN